MILGFKIETPNKDLRLYLDFLQNHIYTRGMRQKIDSGLFTFSNWEDFHLNNDICRRE
jgi:hypothetical protein